MRVILDHHLEARRIFSRRVVQDLAALEEEGVSPLEPSRRERGERDKEKERK